MNRVSLYPPTLDGNSVKEKRKEIKNYFNNSYSLFEKIFEFLKDDSVFYKKSEPTRHPMIFYFGHTATFFINKLINMKIIDTRVNPHFESMFAVGVDEMSWDDVDSSNYNWAEVSEVKEYRDRVREIVNNLIDSIEFTLPITEKSDMWIILMGIEHERIHIETSLVLHRQMPLEFIKDVSDFNIFIDTKNTPQNEMIAIEARTIELGKDKEHSLYGWDNEYGRYREFIDKFEVSKYLVSNREYLEFIEAGGYENLQFWDDEGKNFLKVTGAKYPIFWVKIDGNFQYRTVSKIIDMPSSFPVDVNALEAEAFCRYKSFKEGKKYSLPSEGEYKAIYEESGLSDIKELDKIESNQNLIAWSASPVDRYNFNGIYDVVGNVWQWSQTAIFGFEGFEVHPAYDDFSTPTFDTKHSIILGSSWASSGNLIMKDSRYAFRKHFYQNAGFRYVISSSNKQEKVNRYENDVVASCKESYLSDVQYSYISKSMKYIKSTSKAIDFGCKTGQSSFELARYFNQVDGVDISVRFIRVGVTLQEKDFVDCEDEKIALDNFGYERVKHQVVFKQGDPNNLKESFRGYDFVVARVDDSETFLKMMRDRVNRDAVFVFFNNLSNVDGFEIVEQSDNFTIVMKR